LFPIFWVLKDALRTTRLKRALHHPNEEIRLHAVNTLQAMNIQKFTGLLNIPSLQLLLNACDDQNEQIRHVAITALHHKITMRVREHAGSKTSLSIPVKDKLDIVLKQRIVTACLQRLNDSFSPIQKEATIILRDFNTLSQAVPLLINNLTNSNPRVREESAKTLGIANAPQATLPLITTLKDDDPFVRLHAARALGYLKDKRAQQALLDRLHDKDDLVRAEAAEALQCIGDSRAFHTLIPLLEDTHQEVRKEATRTLTVICASLHTIIFGQSAEHNMSRQTMLHNPDVSTLISPMTALKHIIIHTGTYDFYQVERFLTYAVNHIGQKHLKNGVDVYLYGNPEKLHPNLYNNLTNLCKHVYVKDNNDTQL
jgi:hypothetical protein